MRKALSVRIAELGEAVRFVGCVGKPGGGEEVGGEDFEGWHTAADYADFELDASVHGLESAWVVPVGYMHLDGWRLGVY